MAAETKDGTVHAFIEGICRRERHFAELLATLQSVGQFTARRGDVEAPAFQDALKWKTPPVLNPGNQILIAARISPLSSTCPLRHRQYHHVWRCISCMLGLYCFCSMDARSFPARTPFGAFPSLLASLPWAGSRQPVPGPRPSQPISQDELQRPLGWVTHSVTRNGPGDLTVASKLMATEFSEPYKAQSPGSPRA